MGRGGAAGDLVTLSSELTGRSFSREQESRADAFGLSLVVAEFGHVNGATDFFEKLPAPEGAIERSLSTYLATHPISDAARRSDGTARRGKGLVRRTV